MFCGNCGEKLNEGQLFCSKCGTKVENKEQKKEIEVKKQEVTSETKQTFCGECGNKLKENQIFCAKCGAKIGEEASKPKVEIKAEEPKQKVTYVSSTKKKSKKSIVWVIIILLVALIGGGYYYLDSTTKPEAIIKDFCETMIKADYEKMFKVMNLPESEYISSEAFYEYMKDSFDEDEAIESYEFKYIEKYSSNTEKVYEVTFTIDGQKTKTSITLVKNGTKKYFLFEDWKVTIDDLIVEEWNISIPAGATLYVDDKEVKEGKETKDEMDTYTLSTLLDADYNVKVISPISEEYNKDLSAGRSQTIELKAKESLKDEVKSFAEEFTESIYVAVLGDTDTVTLEGVKGYSKNNATQISEQANKMRTSIKSELTWYYTEAFFENIVVSDFNVTKATVINSNKIAIEASFKLAFDYIFEDAYNPSLKSTSKTRKLEITLENKDNEWIVINIK